MFFQKVVSDEVRFVDIHMHPTVLWKYIPFEKIIELLAARGFKSILRYVDHLFPGQQDKVSRSLKFIGVVESKDPLDIVQNEQKAFELIFKNQNPVYVPLNKKLEALIARHNGLEYDSKYHLLITGIPSKELEEELKSCYSEEEHRKTIAEDCEFARRYDLTDHYQSLRGLLFLVGLTMNFDYAEFVSNAFINTSGLEPYCNQFEANFGLKDRLESGTFAPTYALDARDPQLMRHVEEAYNRGVRVFKIYPSLGYAVSDLRLYPFYEWAEKTQVNIISHSGIGGFENPLLSKIDNVWNDDKKQYEDKQFRSILPWNWFAPEKKAWFNHPKNWIPVLAKFPYLRLDLAHNGGYEHLPGYAKALMNKSRIPKDNATAAIVELCRQYDNVVTDFSYTGYGDKIYDHLLTIFQNPETRDMQYKTCFGTDNDLVLMEMDLFKYVKRFFHFWNAAGNNEYKAYFKNISRDNAARWLNGEELNP